MKIKKNTISRYALDAKKDSFEELLMDAIKKFRESKKEIQYGNLS